MWGLYTSDSQGLYSCHSHSLKLSKISPEGESGGDAAPRYIYYSTYLYLKQYASIDKRQERLSSASNAPNYSTSTNSRWKGINTLCLPFRGDKSHHIAAPAANMRQLSANLDHSQSTRINPRHHRKQTRTQSTSQKASASSKRYSMGVVGNLALRY